MYGLGFGTGEVDLGGTWYGESQAGVKVVRVWVCSLQVVALRRGEVWCGGFRR